MSWYFLGGFSAYRIVPSARCAQLSRGEQLPPAGVLTRGFLAWWVTGDIAAAPTIGASEALLEPVLCGFPHERIGQQVPRAAVRPLLRGG